MHTKEIRAELTSLVLYRVRDDFASLIYPVTVCFKPATVNYYEGYADYKWEPIHMRDLKDIKEAMVSYGIHSPYVHSC